MRLGLWSTALYTLSPSTAKTSGTTCGRPSGRRRRQPGHPRRGEPLSRSESSGSAAVDSSAIAASQRSSAASTGPAAVRRQPVRRTRGIPGARSCSNTSGSAGHAHRHARRSGRSARARSSATRSTTSPACVPVREPARRRTRARGPARSGRRRRRAPAGAGAAPASATTRSRRSRRTRRGSVASSCGPDLLHRLHPLGTSRHPGPRVGAVVAHLLAVPARADAELEAARRTGASTRGDLLGGRDRVALVDQADAAADPQPAWSPPRPRSARRTGRRCACTSAGAPRPRDTGSRGSAGMWVCSAKNSDSWPRSSIIRASAPGPHGVVGGEIADSEIHGPSGLGECLRLERIELGLGDRARVEQLLGVLDLLGR